MRLSDVKGERVIDVIADIIDPIANISSDPVAAELFTRRHVPKGMSAKAFMVQRVRTSLPALLKGHKRDVITVLATIQGVSAEEYTESLTLVKLIKDCMELMTDDLFNSLFTSAETETPSGSATETITDAGE